MWPIGWPIERLNMGFCVVSFECVSLSLMVILVVFPVVDVVLVLVCVFQTRLFLPEVRSGTTTTPPKAIFRDTRTLLVPRSKRARCIVVVIEGLCTTYCNEDLSRARHAPICFSVSWFLLVFKKSLKFSEQFGSNHCVVWCVCQWESLTVSPMVVFSTGYTFWYETRVETCGRTSSVVYRDKKLSGRGLTHPCRLWIDPHSLGGGLEQHACV